MVGAITTCAEDENSVQNHATSHVPLEAKAVAVRLFGIR